MVPVFHELSTTVELPSPPLNIYFANMKGGSTMKRVLPYIVLFLLFFCLTPAYGQSNCPVYTFRKIADTDTPVPGGNGGTFDGLKLSMPAVDGLRVAFRGEGGGEEGVFVGDGQTLSPMAVVGDPLSGGGAITDISRDFAYSGDVMNIIAIPSNGVRGIYNIDATGSSNINGYGNWDLGADRANFCRRIMLQNGIRTSQIKEVRSYADTKPLDDEDPSSPRNRRVSILVLNDFDYLFDNKLVDFSEADSSEVEPE